MFNDPAGQARRRQSLERGRRRLASSSRDHPYGHPQARGPAGTQMPWCAGFDKHSASFEITKLRAAAYIFTGVMTMVRDSELQGLAPGCLGTRNGAPVGMAGYINTRTPAAEIALGITMEHVAPRALANATTSGYGSPTAAWAREFGHEAQIATAAELVSEWSQHAEGQRISRVPGTAQFNAGLDHVTRQYAKSPAHTGDGRTLRNLLRDEFSDLRIGTSNHCLGAADTAGCSRAVTGAPSSECADPCLEYAGIV